MYVLHARNVNDAFVKGMSLLRHHGYARDSRNGQTILAPYPVVTEYTRPKERVLFNELRDANPFFHLAEALWMLAGRNDVDFVARYVDRMRSFSDDGVTFHGAYGYRWRHWFAHDQIDAAIRTLKASPDSRRVVVSMWDGRVDPRVAAAGGKDVPCNTHLYFSISFSGHLDMTVCNRSNDMLWGGYGANVVHMSLLQEYVALALGVDVGTYYQMSNNFHVYKDRIDLAAPVALMKQDFYNDGTAFVEPLMPDTDVARFQDELHLYMNDEAYDRFTLPFFSKVAVPLRDVYVIHKKFGSVEGLHAFGDYDCDARNDWVIAASLWLQRRADAVKAIS